MKFIIENNVLVKAEVERSDKNIVIPSEVTEIGKDAILIRSDFSGFYNYRSSRNQKYFIESLYIPDSVKRYRKGCLSVNVELLDLPYRPSLELAFEDTSVRDRAKRINLRFENDHAIRFDLSDVHTENKTRLLLKVIRTKDLSLFAPTAIKAPIALFMALNENNEEADMYVKKNATDIGKFFINCNDIKSLNLLLNSQYIGKRQTDTLLKYIMGKDQTLQNKEIQVLLMQYKFENFTERKNTDRFRL